MNGRATKLMMTCRDTNGANQIIPLAKAAMARGNVALTLLADEVGLAVLRNAGLPVATAEIAAVGRDDEAGRSAALARARELLAEHRPDAIICGYSGPKSGLDEAVVAVASQETTFLLQDFWGDINPGFGRLPGTAFVLDEAAERLTRHRFAVRTVVTGMPKFEAYAHFDVARMRARTRNALGLGDERRVIAVFGQPLWHESAYRDGMAELFATLREFPSVTVLLRRHPRDESSELRRLGQSLESVLDTGKDRFGAIEDVLAACDVACSAYSSSCHDMIVMNRVASEPIGQALYYLPHALRGVYRKDIGHDSLPPVDAGLALVAGTPATLKAGIEQALDPESREAAWRHIRDASPEVGGASDRILDHVLTAVGQRVRVA